MPDHSPFQPRYSAYVARAQQSDLMARSGFTPTQRHAVMIAAIAALPLDSRQQEKELSALLEDGCPVELAEDILVQMAAYLGYLRAAQSLDALGRACKGAGLAAAPFDNSSEDTSAEGRYQRGIADYSQLNPNALATIKSAFGEISEDFIHMTFRAFGDVFASSRQPLPIRQLATISALAVLGNAAPQLRFHINAGFHIGVDQEQIVEVIAWTQFFAGMPAAYNAMVELKSALSEGAAPAYQ